MITDFVCVEVCLESASQEVGGADPESAAGLRELSQGMAISLAYSLYGGSPSWVLTEVGSCALR